MMSALAWRGERSLEDWLFDEPHAFDFLQAVRLLEMRAGRSDAMTGPLSVGAVVRFHAAFDLSFAATEIRDLRRPKDGAPADMTVGFFGTGAADGPLPTSFTEEILERLRQHDTAAAAFFDIFHHRLVALLYRIHKAHRFSLASVAPQHTPFARYILSLAGLGLPSLTAQLTAPAALLRYAGLVGARPRSAAGLATLVSDYFGVPVRVEQFVGAWCAMDPDQRTRIGVEGRNNAIGSTAVVGSRVWIQDAGIMLRLGPLDADRFDGFLPGGRAHAALNEIVRLYAGPDLDIRLQLVLRADDVSRARLGAARIGWSGWLRTTPATDADSQVRVRLSGRTIRGAA
jgi:type VI secretion system protein ImpH